MMENEPTSSHKVLRPDFPTTPIERRNRRKTDNPTGGDGGNGMEVRLSKIETDIAVIKNSLGWIKGLGGGIFALVTLLIGLSVGGYFGLAGKVEDNAKSLVRIESSADHITKQLDGMAKLPNKN
jgi:hypothetical protein